MDVETIDAFAVVTEAGILFVSFFFFSFYFPTAHGKTWLLSTVHKSKSMTSMFSHKADEENILFNLTTLE